MNERESTKDFLATAETVVREAGAVAREMFGRVDILGDHGKGNVFTQADVAVDRHICSRLTEAFPAHDIVSEESDRTGADSRHVWVLDPIDGTRYFRGGVPLYSVSLALEIEGRPVLGVVYNPEAEQLFSAATGHGAFLNGSRIRCSDKKHLRDSTVCFETPHQLMSDAVRDAAGRAFATLIGCTERLRILGASAIGLCYCASGAFDLYVNMSTGSKAWDLAAGSVILRESGAQVTTHGDYIIGAPPALREQLFAALPSLNIP